MVSPPNVLAIGSCRIFRPLRPIHEQREIVLLNYGQSQWFTHTAAAARQYVDIIQGKTTIPIPLRELALEVNDIEPYLGDMSSPMIRDVDVVVVEVSSLKESRVDGIELNAHKVYHEALKFTGDYKGIVNGVTSELPNGHILKNLQVMYTTPEKLDDDLLAVRDTVGSPVITVNHLPSFFPDGTPTPERAKLTQELRRVEAQHGLPLFDTNPAVIEAGIDIALVDHNHYRPEFESVVGKHLLQKIRQLLDTRAPS